MATPKNRGIVPIPAVFHRADTPADVQDKTWTFRQVEDTGATDLDARIMSIPTDDSSESAGIRAHEMLHVAMSPYNAKAMDMQTLAAEDGRVETLATHAGVKRPMPATPSRVRKILATASANQLPLLAVATTGAPTESIVREWLTANGHTDLTSLMGWAKAQYLAGADSDVVADKLRHMSERYGVASDRPESAPLPGHAAHKPEPPPKEAPKEAPGEGTGTKHNPPSMTLPVKAEDYVPPTPQSNAFGERNVTWATMQIDKPCLPVTVSDVQGGKRSRATAEGIVPRNLWRTDIDGKVFAARKHRRQGTVLIDASASMPLEPEVIEQFVRQAPAAVAAIYWGNPIAEAGTVRIVADNGRIAEPGAFERDGYGNMIDGPALWWLSRQRAPRLWVSDGVITGIDDSPPTPRMRAEVASVLRHSRIRRIDPNLEDDWRAAVTKALY